MEMKRNAFSKHCFRDLAITYLENVTSDSGKNKLRADLILKADDPNA
jgi:hypothetical protein